jgi:hypothetical protein
MSLSICLLTRDAEPRIGAALRSVADLGAEVIVADTGSTDGTVAAARAAGSRVLTVAWHDDFAAAQNEALSQATGDWVLCLNPDEELSPYPREQLVALLARPEVLAYGVRVQEVVKPDPPNLGTVSWQLRLYRRHPEVRYIGRLHPHFVVPLEELARRENQRVEMADLVVKRHGYLSVLTEATLRWATRLLELELSDRPGQLHYLIEYGRNLLRLNDARGHAVLAEASGQVLAAGEAPAPPTPTVASLLEYLLTVAPEQCQSSITPEQARALALRWFPVSPPLLWALAQASFQANDFRDAATHLERSLYLGRTGTYDRSAAFDPGVMGERALLNLGHCYARLGDLGRAEACYSQLLASPNLQAQARQGFDRVRQLRDRNSGQPRSGAS